MYWRALGFSCWGVVGANTAFAQAQRAVDAHGDTPLSTVSDYQSVFLTPPLAGLAHSFEVHTMFEWVKNPLIAYELLPALTTPRALVEISQISTFTLGGAYQPIERLGVGLSVPVVLASRAGEQARFDAGGGVTLSDIRLSVPVGLVLPEEDYGYGPSVTITPWLGAPTGKAVRLVGGGTFTGGLLVSAGLRGKRLWALGSLGARYLGTRTAIEAISDETQRFGGLGADGGVGAGLTVSSLSVGVESRFWTLGGQQGDVPGYAMIPVEVLGTVGFSFGQKGFVAGSVGGGTTGGIGVGVPRAAIYGRHREVGRLQPLAPIKVEAEGWSLHIIDHSNNPVVAASVKVGSQVYVADAAGRIVLPHSTRWSKGVVVSAAGFESTEVIEPDDEVRLIDVQLEWMATALEVRVTNRDGEPIQATLLVTNEDGLSLKGTPAEIELRPGIYRVETVAPGFGSQVREVVVPERGQLPSFDVVLAEPLGEETAAFLVVDEDGSAIEGARILLDGEPLGTLSTGGAFEVSSLTAGLKTIEIRHPDYTPTFLEVAVGEVSGAQKVVVKRIPGSVRVRVRGPSGEALTDATVRFFGPSRLPPMPIGDTGQRLQTLGEGRWRLLITSPTAGAQERELVIEPDSYELIEVDVVLQPPELGNAELLLRVVDPAGQAVDGVAVSLDGKAFGLTSTGGSLSLSGLDEGIRTLVLERDGLQPSGEILLNLVSGPQEQIVPVLWETGRVQVDVSGPNGSVKDATVRFIGDGGPPPTKLTRGKGTFVLGTGEWTVMVSSPTLGMQSRQIMIPKAYDRVTTVSVVLQPMEGGLAELLVAVRDPSGFPVEGAKIVLDDLELGRTPNTGMVHLEQLALGARSLRIEHSSYRSVQRTIRLMEGDNQIEEDLSWGAGLVQVTVTGDDERLHDAMVRYLGPVVMAPAPVDQNAEHQVVLPPGDWQILATSPTFGMAQMSLSITEESEPQEITINLSKVDTGMSQLLVRVVNPDDAPVAGVVVAFDGEDVGRTGYGGTLLIDELAPSLVVVTASAPNYRNGLAQIDLQPGSQERIVGLSFIPTDVLVTVTDTDDLPIDAQLRFVGPGDVEAQHTGADGQLSTSLRPGYWTVIATSPGLGPGRVDLRLSAGGGQKKATIRLDKARLQIDEQMVRISELVVFGFNERELRSDAGPILDQVANMLLSRSKATRVEVQGHTDNVGTAAYNQDLSEMRAQAVLEALVKRGVPRELLIARGYGPQRPVSDNNSELGRAQNRRVEFAIIE